MRRIDAPLRALANRLARDRRVAATVIDHPELATAALGLTAADIAVLGVLADARAAYRLAHPVKVTGARRPTVPPRGGARAGS